MFANEEVQQLKLVVLGATGGIGLELVRQALNGGHDVTAFVRDAEKLKEFGDRIRVFSGNLLDADETAQVIQTNDAILSAFGPRVPVSKNDATLLRQFAHTLTSAMTQAGIRRVIVVSTAFLFKDAVMPPAYLFGRLFFPGIVEDASGMEEVIQSSGLDWTIVRPPQLTDASITAKYRATVGHLPNFGFKISRSDTADFMLKTVGDRGSFGKVIGVSY
jgi:putative NADH-flavin reductase